MSKTEINTNKLLELENKLHKYQKALEFYASSNTYAGNWKLGSGRDFYDWVIPINRDAGSTAREALKDES